MIPGITAQVGADASAPPTDPYWANVELLLYGEGADGSTTFTDHSVSGRALTPFGNVQHDTAIDVYGQSILFDGSGDYITTPMGTDLSAAFGDFCWEAYVKISAFNTGQSQVFFGTRPPSTSRGGELYFNSDGTRLGFAEWNSSGSYIGMEAVISVSAGTIYHVAVSREGTTRRIFLDGVLVGTNSTGITADGGSQVFNIGRTGDTAFSRFLKGSLNWVRVTSGNARYTEGFTPPLVPLS